MMRLSGRWLSVDPGLMAFILPYSRRAAIQESDIVTSSAAAHGALPLTDAPFCLLPHDANGHRTTIQLTDASFVVLLIASKAKATRSS